MSAMDFTRLTEADQREVARRLIRIEESGWKPFWCPDPECDGSPHPVLDGNGDVIFVGVRERFGPNGEPLSEIVYEDDDGELFIVGAGETAEGVAVGRMVLDPVWAHNHARVDQRLPAWNKPWSAAFLSGRGSGKTTTGSEFVTLSARKGLDGLILGRRGIELVNTHVATIIARAHPEFTPEYFASKDILVWPEVEVMGWNGKKVKRRPTTYLFSAEKPENIRSVNVSYAWIDEAAHMDEIKTAWMNIKLANRIDWPNSPIHTLITSTPTPTEWMMEIEDDESIEVRRVSTYANKANLSPDYLAELAKSYEGTRIGRQELHGEVLRDVEGALWNDSMFLHEHVSVEVFEAMVESMDARVVAVDPAGSKGPRSDATGIIGAGAQHFDDDGNRLMRSNFYVMARATIKGTPTEWAAQTFKCAHLMNADYIVAEKNFGGDMVKQVLSDYAALHTWESEHPDPNVYDADGELFAVKVEHAVKSKETRAEATVAKYEQQTVTHVVSPTPFGDLSELEKQQTKWVPKSRGGRMASPNDIDALVWAVRALESKVKYVGQMATSRQTLKKLKRRRAS